MAPLSFASPSFTGNICVALRDCCCKAGALPAARWLGAAQPNDFWQSNHCVRIAPATKPAKLHLTWSYVRSDDVAVDDLEHLACQKWRFSDWKLSLISPRLRPTAMSIETDDSEHLAWSCCRSVSFLASFLHALGSAPPRTLASRFQWRPRTLASLARRVPVWPVPVTPTVSPGNVKDLQGTPNFTVQSPRCATRQSDPQEKSRPDQRQLQVDGAEVCGDQEAQDARHQEVDASEVGKVGRPNHRQATLSRVTSEFSRREHTQGKLASQVLLQCLWSWPPTPIQRQWSGASARLGGTGALLDAWLDKEIESVLHLFILHAIVNKKIHIVHPSFCVPVNIFPDGASRLPFVNILSFVSGLRHVKHIQTGSAKGVIPATAVRTKWCKGWWSRWIAPRMHKSVLRNAAFACAQVSLANCKRELAPAPPAERVRPDKPTEVWPLDS